MAIIQTVIQGGGTTPTGTLQITTNGTHDVTNYATADVQVPTTAPEMYRAFRNNNGKLENSITTPFIPLSNTVTDIGDFLLVKAYANTPSSVLNGAIDLSSLTSISGQYACQNMFADCTGITSVNLSSLTTVSGSFSCNYMFYRCTGITSVNLSSLTNIVDSTSRMGCDSMFRGCNRLTSADLSSLTTINSINACQYMFADCTGITSVNLSSLTSILSNYSAMSMFAGCTGITNVHLPSLAILNAGVSPCGSMFSGCTGLTNIYFYALTPSSFGSRTNQFNNMLSGVTGCIVHFPMAIQSTIGSWSDVTNGFGGTNTTVLFDIVTTLTGADTNSYTRKEKESTSTATAWTYNNTLYYTSGTTEPTVGATIYSDSACTTAVTTISAIA